MKVDTSVRKWQITFETALDALAPDASYRLKASISDHGKPVTEFTSDAVHGRRPEGRPVRLHPRLAPGQALGHDHAAEPV